MARVIVDGRVLDASAAARGRAAMARTIAGGRGIASAMAPVIVGGCMLDAGAGARDRATAMARTIAGGRWIASAMARVIVGGCMLDASAGARDRTAMARTIAGGRWIASAMARVIVGGCVLLAATAASASPFVNLDRQDIGSAGGADLTYFVLDSGDGTLLRLEPHGHYVDPGSNVGGYLTMPIAFFSGDSESGTALGDLEVGAIYAPVVGESTVILHGGVALPTSREGNDDAFVGVVAGYLRPHDIFTTFPETTTVRTGVSPIFRSGKGVFRIDIGVDVPLDVPEGFDPYAMVHINFGGSYQVTETAAVNVELVTGRFLGDNDNDTISAAGLGMRFWTGNLSPYFSFVLPLDDEISNIIDVGVTLGLEATL